jgi:hypothetical protein
LIATVKATVDGAVVVISAYAGLKEQTAYCGRLLHEKSTAPEKPATADTVTEMAAPPPTMLEELTDNATVGFAIRSGVAGDVEARKLESPLYVAVMLYCPTASGVVAGLMARVAEDEDLLRFTSDAVPSEVVPL